MRSHGRHIGATAGSRSLTSDRSQAGSSPSAPAHQPIGGPATPRGGCPAGAPAYRHNPPPPGPDSAGRSIRSGLAHATVDGMENVIECDHLRKRYRSTVAVDDVSFTVRRGEIFGILGPNGAGKTTTVECLSGLRTPDTGRLRVLGLDPRRDRQALRLRLGVQLQESQLQDKL